MNSQVFLYVTAVMAISEMCEVICDNNTVHSFTEQMDMEWLCWHDWIWLVVGMLVGLQHADVCGLRCTTVSWT